MEIHFLTRSGLARGNLSGQEVEHMSKIYDNEGSFAITVAALIVVLVVVLAIAAVLFLPVKAVNFNEYRSVRSETGVNKLNLKLSTDIGEIRIIYTNLSGQALNLHVNGKGSVGYLMDPNSISLDFVQSTSADTAIVNATINVKDRLLGASNLNLHCDVLVDSSMRSKLDLSTSAGSIMVNTTNATAFDQIKLSAKAGSVTLQVVSGVSLYGDVSLSTNFGASILDWTNPIVKQNIAVETSTRAGGVELHLSQTTPMSKTVTFNGTTATGGVSLNMDITGHIGATINSTSNLGGVHVVSRTGFVGDDKDLSSTNYPDDGDLVVHLRTNVGGVEVNALSVP